MDRCTVMMTNIKLDDIKLLYLVLKHQNLGVACKNLNISQPVATVRLNKLRDRFKDKLISRVGNHMELTEKGRSLLSDMQSLSEHIDSIFSHAVIDPYKDSYNINLLVNEHYTVSCNELEVLVNKIYDYNPNHTISVQAMPLKFDRMMPDANFHDIDAIIGAIMPIDGFEYECINHFDTVLAYDQYPLAEREITLDEYKTLPHIATDFGRTNSEFLKSFNNSDPRNIKIRTTSLHVLKKLLSDKYVATLIRGSAINCQLNYIELSFLHTEYDVYFLYPSRLKHDAKNKWVRSLVRSAFGKKN
jgi:DNA-binding transcriptional LysR family regulator